MFLTLLVLLPLLRPISINMAAHSVACCRRLYISRHAMPRNATRSSNGNRPLVIVYPKTQAAILVQGPSPRIQLLSRPSHGGGSGKELPTTPKYINLISRISGY